MSADEPWATLRPGDGFVVRSLSGKAYGLTYLGRGDRHAGLYVRFRENGRLARFYLDMLDWTTFERSDNEPVLTRDSEVLILPSAGVEHRGKVVEVADNMLLVRLLNGAPVAVVRSDLPPDGVKLLFWATDWRAGDFFLVESRSGREYRGLTLNVLFDKVEAVLSSRFGAGEGQRVALRLGQLNMKSFRVMVPIPLESIVGCKQSVGGGPPVLSPSRP